MTIFNDLLYVSEHLTCKHYMVDLSFGFHYQEYPSGIHESARTIDRNIIIFILEGSLSFSYDQFSNRVFTTGDILFIPKASTVDGKVIQDAKVVYMAFDVLTSPCDKQNLILLDETCKQIKYDFEPLKMNSPMSSFINSLIYYLRNGGSCVHLHEIKQKELFLIFRWFYTKEQVAALLYPIIGRSFDFKNFILDNYAQCNKLEELIKLSNMSPNVFMRKFKKEFGMTAYQWMLKQMCQRIVYKVSHPGISIKEVMIEVGIDDPTHFNRICKRHFNKTPKELIAFYQSNIKNTI